MKQLIKISALVIGFGTLIISCDKEDYPMYPKGLSDNELINLYFPGEPSEYNDTLYLSFPNNTNTDRNVLLEDYTGHLCTNCPPAAVIAKDLEDNNPDRVHVLSVHAGGATNFFQKVVAPKFTTDYTTEEGTAYSVEISGFAGNPSGMVSRTIPAGESIMWTFKDSWASQVSELLAANDLKANIQIEAEFYPSTKGVFVQYQVEALEDLDANTRLLIFVAEKHTYSAQKLEDSSTEDDYEHHNVLSGVLTDGTYGQSLGVDLTAGTVAEGIVINGLDIMNSNRVVNEDGENDLVVFACVVNNETKEILQVVKKDVVVDAQL